MWLRAASGGDRVHVLDFAVEEGDWSAGTNALDKALKAFIDKHGIARDAVYSVLPRHGMTARILTLPTQDPREIGGMIRLSAGEYVPYAIEELVIDQCVLDELPDGASRVMTVFAHRDLIETHLAVLGAAGVEPQKVFMSSACFVSAAVAARTACDERYAVVNLASGGLEVVVLCGRSLEYDRGIGSAQDWGLLEAPSGEALEELVLEVRASLSAYRRESEEGLSPDAIYLSSEWMDVARTAELLTQQTGYTTSPAWFGRDLTGRGADKLPCLSLVALGGVLAAQGRAALDIDLTPPSVIKRRRSIVTRRKAVRWAAAIMLLGLATFGLYFQSYRQRTAVLEALDARIAAIETNARDVVSKQRQLQILQNQVERKGSLLELLAALCEVAPPSNLNITRITFEHGSELNIWGRARTLNEVNDFTQALRQLGESTIPQFVNARRLYEVQTPERDETIYAFAVGIPFPETEETEAEE
ncbi:MAG TPA: hypothetical protein ENN80_08160 [Candidatus Hydrogenedentes bacterium]|nr:hypothetical protein [Candidatus Hydrogenedentota bacterium]